MPIHKVEGGWQWGGRGKVYASRAAAARQARAAYANGYVGKASTREIAAAAKRAHAERAHRAKWALKEFDGTRAAYLNRLNTAPKRAAQMKVLRANSTPTRKLMEEIPLGKSLADIGKEYRPARDTASGAALVGAGGLAAASVGSGRIVNRMNQKRATEGAARVARLDNAYAMDVKGQLKHKGDYDIPDWRKISGVRQIDRKAARRVATATRRADRKRLSGAINEARAMSKPLPKSYRNKFQLGTAAGAAALGALGTHGFVEKGDAKPKSHGEANAAILGGAGAIGAHQGIVYGTKPLNRRYQAQIAKDPELKRVMEEHHKKYAPKHKGAMPHHWKPYFRNYPKNVPGGSLQRVMSRVGANRTGPALSAGLGVAGALGASRMYRRMKSEDAAVGKALAGTNVREYDFLPENVRDDVGYGSIRTRRNPMSALDLFASSRIMAEASARASGERLSRRRLSRRAHNEMAFAGSRAMLYSPAGRGSVF